MRISMSFACCHSACSKYLVDTKGRRACDEQPSLAKRVSLRRGTLVELHASFELGIYRKEISFLLCVVLKCIKNPNLTESRWSSFSNLLFFFSLFSVLVVSGCDVCCIETLWNWKSGGSDCSTTSLRTQKRNSRYLSQSNTGSRCSKLHFFLLQRTK